MVVTVGTYWWGTTKVLLTFLVNIQKTTHRSFRPVAGYLPAAVSETYEIHSASLPSLSPAFFCLGLCLGSSLRSVVEFWASGVDLPPNHVRTARTPSEVALRALPFHLRIPTDHWHSRARRHIV